MCLCKQALSQSAETEAMDLIEKTAPSRTRIFSFQTQGDIYAKK